MTKTTDSRIRVVLLAVAAAAIVASFVVSAHTDLDRLERFVWLSLLGVLVVFTGGEGLDIIQAYPKRRPFRLRWGKPRTDLGPEIESPIGAIASDWQVIASLRPAPLIAALAASSALAVVFGALSYAVAGSPSPNGRGLILYLVFAAALRQTAKNGFRQLVRKTSLSITAEAAHLGPALGYIPSLTISRQAVDAIEVSTELDRLAFTTADRRYEASMAMLDAVAVKSQLAGLWPEIRWHELSPDAIRTTIGGIE